MLETCGHIHYIEKLDPQVVLSKFSITKMVDLERLLNAKRPASKKHNPSKLWRPRKKPAKPIEHQEYVHGSSEEEPVGHLSLVQMVAQIYKSMYKYMLYIYIMYFTYNIMYIYIHIYIYVYTSLYLPIHT